MAKNLMQQVLLKPKKDSFNIKGLVEKIESGYLVGQNEPQFRKKRSFSPSALAWGSGACARYWYIAFDGAEFVDEKEPYAIANMRNGTLSHTRIQEAMKNSGILVESELKLTNDDPPMLGYLDAMIEWKQEHLPVEIKTMREESFQYRKNAGLGASYHIMQLLLYMYLLKKKRGLLAYESKNTHELLFIPVELNDFYKQWTEDTIEWMRSVRKAWVDRTLPVKTYRSNSKVCKGCPVQAACAAMPKGDTKILPLVQLD